MTAAIPLRDATVVVTGAAGGIGRALAERLAREGTRVIAVDRDETGLSALEGCERVACDLTTREGRARAVAAGPDATHLVNAAGRLRARPLEQVEEEDWDVIFDVNAKALFFLCQAFCPRLPPGGAVVNASSIAGKLATTVEVAVYAATKAAVLSITRSFAHAYGPAGVRVNAVCPGLIDSPMQDALVTELAHMRSLDAGELRQKRTAGTALGREGDVDEVADAIHYLLSERSSYVTGQAINVCGGMLVI